MRQESNNHSRIKMLRKERKLSGIKVAEKLGITPQYYYDIERGERRLTTDIAGRLADIFHITVDYLLGKTDLNLYNWVQENEGEKQKKNLPLHENERELISKIDLSDDELLKQFTFVFEGKELAEKDVKRLLAYIRAERSLDE